MTNNKSEKRAYYKNHRMIERLLGGQNGLLPGDPLYGSKEDIFKKGDRMNINPEDLDASAVEDSSAPHTLKKTTGTDPSKFDQDLDVPGAEDDDSQEQVGEEDEENNYYSLGGARHDMEDQKEDD